MAILKVQGHSGLIKETKTKAVINTNVSEYNIYMARLKNRNKQKSNIVDQVQTLLSTTITFALFN